MRTGCLDMRDIKSSGGTLSSPKNELLKEIQALQKTHSLHLDRLNSDTLPPAASAALSKTVKQEQTKLSELGEEYLKLREDSFDGGTKDHPKALGDVERTLDRIPVKESIVESIRLNLILFPNT